MHSILNQLTKRQSPVPKDSEPSVREGFALIELAAESLGATPDVETPLAASRPTPKLRRHANTGRFIQEIALLAGRAATTMDLASIGIGHHSVTFGQDFDPFDAGRTLRPVVEIVKEHVANGSARVMSDHTGSTQVAQFSNKGDGGWPMSASDKAVVRWVCGSTQFDDAPDAASVAEVLRDSGIERRFKTQITRNRGDNHGHRSLVTKVQSSGGGFSTKGVASIAHRFGGDRRGLSVSYLRDSTTNTGTLWVWACNSQGCNGA